MTVHPFVDGNGRIGRAIAEKCLSESAGQPTLTLLSRTIEANRKTYYDNLAETNRTMDVSAWVSYFAKTMLTAQKASIDMFDFVIQKTQMLDTFGDQLNERQEKVVHKMFDQGPEGFEGGLSAGNYQQIAKTSKATATRDLDRLVELGVLYKEGQLKSTRYYLKLEPDSAS